MEIAAVEGQLRHLAPGDDIGFLGRGGFDEWDLGFDGDGFAGLTESEADDAEFHDLVLIEGERGAFEGPEAGGFHFDGVAAGQQGAESEAAGVVGDSVAGDELFGLIDRLDAGIGDGGALGVIEGSEDGTGLAEGSERP